jgi:hypothetical protein
MKEKYIEQWTNLYPEQINVRLEKRAKLEEQEFTSIQTWGEGKYQGR